MTKYLTSYFSIFSILLLLVSSPIFFLFRVGEYKGLDTVIKEQRAEKIKIIYGTAIHSNTHLYKKMLMRFANPKIIVLGSSRVMQFRQHMFLKKFINLGGAMNSINEGIAIATDILKNKTELIIFGIDMWWLNHAYQNPLINNTKKGDSTYNPTLRDTYTVAKWLFLGKIYFTDIFEKTINTSVDIGIRGQYKDGFGPDGSHYYTRLITGKKENDDRVFRKTLQRIKTGNTKFIFSLKDSRQKFSTIIQVIRRFEKSGSRVIVFFPPFASEVNNYLNDIEGYNKFFSKLKSNLSNNGINFYDYTDALLLGSNDCEFIDGIHGGEVTYMRILNDIFKKEMLLSGYVDLPYLQRLISLHSGRAFVPDSDITNINETDFLGIGCRK